MGQSLSLATGEGGKRPTRAEEVTELRLADTVVSGAGLKELALLKNLTKLTVPDRAVTDAGLASLRELGLLHALPLAKDKDGKRPTKAEEVITLLLSNTQVTDAGLKELVPLTSLTLLGLECPKVTDAGLKELVPLKNLTTLILLDTKVTDAGVRELQKALPKCRISKVTR